MVPTCCAIHLMGWLEVGAGDRMLGGWRATPRVLLAEATLTPRSRIRTDIIGPGWMGSSGHLGSPVMSKAGKAELAFKWGRKEG